MTIQFVAPTADGNRLLGIGLTLTNLERIEDDDPVVVNLATHEGEGTLLIARAEDEEGVTGARQLLGEPCYVTRLDTDARKRLRRGELLSKPLGDPAFAGLLLFAGADEFELIASLREAGLLANDVPLHGLDEYFLHEAGLCPGCPSCEGRAHDWGAGSARADPHTSEGWRAQDRGARQQQSRVARWLSQPNVAVAFVVGLMAVVAAIIALAAHHVAAVEKRERAVQRAAQREAAKEQTTSDRRRRELLTRALPSLLARPLQAAPCPHKVRAPRALRSRMVMKLSLAPREGETRFENLARFSLVYSDFDILPAKRQGVGPLRQRLHRDNVFEARDRPLDPPLHRSFVITSWRDPVLPKDIDRFTREAPEGQKKTFLAGMVRGRLLVWSYADNRFVCASPEVEALSPDIKLSRRPDLIKMGEKLIDDALNKARIETLIAAMKRATEQLRAVGGEASL